MPYLRPSPGRRVVLGRAGPVSMAAVGIVVNAEGAFPGRIALWPLLSAAAIIVAGNTGSEHGVDRILASDPLVRLGNSAYALCLIHWPLLITYLVGRDRPVAGPRCGVALVLVSIVLAVLVTKLVEDLFQRWSRPERSFPRTDAVVAVCLAVVVVPVLTWQQLEDRRVVRIVAAAERNNPGAAALLPGFRSPGDPDAEPIPVLTGDHYRKPVLGEFCHADLRIPDEYQEWCFDTVAHADPAATLMVVGNSHVHQWIRAIEHLAERNDWRVVTFIRGHCMHSAPEDEVVDHEPCARRLEGTDPVVDLVDPELVLVQGTRSTTEDEETFSPGTEARIRDLAAQGVEVIGLRDNARFDTVASHCAQEKGPDAPECAPTHTVLGPDSPLRPVADELPGVSTVDLGDLICPGGTCDPVIGNVYTYWDNNHLTVEYVGTLAPMFAERVETALRADGAGPPVLP